MEILYVTMKALGCARQHHWRAALGCAAPRALAAQMAASYACQAGT